MEQHDASLNFATTAQKQQPFPQYTMWLIPH